MNSDHETKLRRDCGGVVCRYVANAVVLEEPAFVGYAMSERFEAYLTEHDALFRRVFRRAVYRRFGSSDRRFNSIDGMGFETCVRRLFYARFRRRIMKKVQ